jgi:hypothetical protein
MVLSIFLSQLQDAFLDLVLAPFREPSLLWQLAPVLLLWILLEVYFIRYRNEELGWNSALANGVSLFWIATSAMQHIFSDNRLVFTWTKFIVISIIILYAIAVIIVAFRHASSSKLAFLMASPTVVYYLSILGLLYAYDMIYPTLPMLVAVVVVFLLVLLIKFIGKKTIPEVGGDEPSGFGSGDSGSDAGFGAMNSTGSLGGDLGSSFDNSNANASMSSAPLQQDLTQNNQFQK